MENNKLGLVKEAKEMFQSLIELSRLLCIELEPETLAICVKLCAAGVNPEGLATIMREFRKQIQFMHEQSNNEPTA